MTHNNFTAEQIRMLNKKSLLDMYYVQHLSANKIATKIGVGANTVCNRLKLYGVELRKGRTKLNII